MASASVKRQRKRKRIDTDGDPEFQVAPMVDVLLVLMLFFMSITSTEVLQKNKNLQLADAKNAKPDEKHHKPGEIIVNIAWDKVNNVAQFSMDGIDYPGGADSLQAPLGSKHGKDPTSYVVVRADKDVQYSNVSDLMAACAGAGISSVSFAVITGGNKSAPAAKAAANSN